MVCSETAAALSLDPLRNVFVELSFCATEGFPIHEDAFGKILNKKIIFERVVLKKQLRVQVLFLVDQTCKACVWAADIDIGFLKASQC